jgi:hypothetical protein
VNVVFLLLSTAVSAGADPASAPIKPAAAPAAAPPAAAAPGPAPVVAHGDGYGSGCGAISDCCETDGCSRHGFLSRLRSRGHNRGCCEAPACDSGCGCGQAVSHGHRWGHSGGSCCGATSSCAPACDTCGETCCKPSLLDRIRARFHKSGCCESACDSGCGCDGGCGGGVIAAPVHGAPVIGAPAGTDKPVEKLKKMPKGEDENKGKTSSPLLTPAGGKVETEVKNPFELARRDEMRVTRAADYSQLTGQLYFVHADGGLWVLRYAPLAQEDANGGSVVLARDRKMDSYREGDLVTIEGQVLSQKGSARLGGPLYRVRTISLVDRPQP